jgi:hypothetical protein
VAFVRGRHVGRLIQPREHTTRCVPFNVGLPHNIGQHQRKPGQHQRKPDSVGRRYVCNCWTAPSPAVAKIAFVTTQTRVTLLSPCVRYGVLAAAPTSLAAQLAWPAIPSAPTDALLHAYSPALRLPPLPLLPELAFTPAGTAYQLHHDVWHTVQAHRCFLAPASRPGGSQMCARAEHAAWWMGAEDTPDVPRPQRQREPEPEPAGGVHHQPDPRHTSTRRHAGAVPGPRH